MARVVLFVVLSNIIQVVALRRDRSRRELDQNYKTARNGSGITNDNVEVSNIENIAKNDSTLGGDILAPLDFHAASLADASDISRNQGEWYPDFFRRRRRTRRRRIDKKLEKANELAPKMLSQLYDKCEHYENVSRGRAFQWDDSFTQRMRALQRRFQDKWNQFTSHVKSSFQKLFHFVQNIPQRVTELQGVLKSFVQDISHDVVNGELKELLGNPHVHEWTASMTSMRSFVRTFFGVAKEVLRVVKSRFIELFKKMLLVFPELQGSALLQQSDAIGANGTDVSASQATADDARGNTSLEVGGNASDAGGLRLEMPSMITDPIKESRSAMLIVSVVIDVVGLLSYLGDFEIPMVPLGEVTDVAWAPLSFAFLQEFYGSHVTAFFGELEEALPFDDVMPTAGLAWLFSYNNAPLFDVARFVMKLPDRTKYGDDPVTTTTTTTTTTKKGWFNWPR
eukprot:TRINITY_DN12308_c0_g1_i3.p1 TRINITY_DN12308_c0_g1~~TRINITY_DN12308_c0_g1_i3.p1  ORF type:complete len:453 (+),score=67.51 TRINITY_DN12308_c0_g1_i3:78-1436(+)